MRIKEKQNSHSCLKLSVEHQEKELPCMVSGCHLWVEPLNFFFRLVSPCSGKLLKTDPSAVKNNYILHSSEKMDTSNSDVSAAYSSTESALILPSIYLHSNLSEVLAGQCYESHSFRKKTIYIISSSDLDSFK